MASVVEPTALETEDPKERLLRAAIELFARYGFAATSARQLADAADVNVAMAELDQTMTKLNGIDQRTSELGTLLDELRSRGVAALDLLESEPFEPHAHAERFQRAMNLVMAVRDVAVTPVLDADGELTEVSGNLTIKYRSMTEDAQDG